MSPGDTPASSDVAGTQITLCFLDDDPVETAGRLEPALRDRWAGNGTAPLLAAPFHFPVPYDLEPLCPVASRRLRPC